VGGRDGAPRSSQLHSSDILMENALWRDIRASRRESICYRFDARDYRSTVQTPSAGRMYTRSVSTSRRSGSLHPCAQGYILTTGKYQYHDVSRPMGLKRVEWPSHIVSRCRTVANVHRVAKSVLQSRQPTFRPRLCVKASVMGTAPTILATGWKSRRSTTWGRDVRDLFGFN
jgi:hypothetical protein